jgi:hypothetical protein
MTSRERSPELVAERLREIASDIFRDLAGADEIRALHNLAEWFDERPRKPASLTYTDTPFGPMGVNMDHYMAEDAPMPDVRETLEAQGETLTALAVAGGQGRTAASVEDDAVGMFAIIAWVVIVVLLALAAGVFWVVLA